MAEKREILCIDLKSFFASVECVARNLDPFSTPLVVCDPERNGAITLAVTPYLKRFGVKGRTRVYELPKDLDIIKVPPRMRLYQQKSIEVMKIYMDFIASEDIHVYSIDEAFLDVTNYLKFYQTDAYHLALDILAKVREQTGLTATAGIGPNMLLAKISMDIEAKHNENFIAEWTMEDIKTKLWPITPLSKMWGIGKQMEKKLNAIGLYKIGDIACYDRIKLKAKFGIIGEELWEHANGIDNAKIQDINKHVVQEKSFSHSQVLFKDYYDYNIHLIILEMIELLTQRLRKHRVLTGLVSFGIGYSKNIGGGFHHSVKLDALTDDEDIIYRTCMTIFNKYYDNLPIRQVSISLGHIQNNENLQLNIFEDFAQTQEKHNFNLAIDEIKERFGPNIILKASSLLEDSTIRERNNKIGGHHA